MNPELPKNVREALAKQAVAGTHPTADLLNAYAERALTSQEDVLVAGHLATCPGCREVIFLANSAAEVPEASALPVERSAVTWWRWAVPVAALVAITAAFLTLNPLRTREAAPQTQEAKVLSPVGSVDTSASKPATNAKPAAEATRSDATGKKRESLSKNSSDAAEAKDKQHAASRVKLPGMPAQAAPAPPPPMAPDSRMMSGVAGGLVANSANNSANVVANSTTSQNINLARGGPSQNANQAVAQNRGQNRPIRIQGVGASSTSADTVEVTTAAPLVPAQAATPASAPQLEEIPARAKSLSTAKATPAMSYVGSSAEVEATGKAHRNPISRMAAELWRITPDGHLERLMQNQWHRALNSVQSAFHVVASVENHVWAGGKGPELFHSADGGENWNKIEVKTADGTLNGTMQSIRADDPKHVSIVTDNGETWITADGGQTWAKQQ